MKTIMVYSPAKFAGEAWLPTFWCQAKTYYEKNGRDRDQWHWWPCHADVLADELDRVKSIIQQARPDVLAISLYVWNASTALAIAQWVKQTMPHCLIVSGGPQQDFKYDTTWFQRHPYIDCSLPGENYGELCIAELLDNWSDSIDFNQISDLRFPMGNNRMLCQSKKSLQDKREFDYAWPSYADQQPAIQDYIQFAKSAYPLAKIMGIVESTRGCPYGCTYCDWGGGINTRVIKKDDRYINADLDFLAGLDLKLLFMADANLGIFGDRDVRLMQRLAQARRHHGSQVKIGYSGFAKTENRLESIKKIMQIDLDNDLSNQNEIKISLQSLHDSVLKNIDRQNIPLDQQVQAFGSLRTKGQFRVYVEMILGLPGINLDLFHDELDQLGQRWLAVQWYEWILLPGTPAYDPQYRRRHSIVTVKKSKGWAYHEPGAAREVVVGGSDFDSDHYLQMLLSAGLYSAIVQGGIYKKSIRHTGANIGDIVRETCESYLADHPEIITQWQEILHDPAQVMEMPLESHKVYVLFYFMAMCFIKPQDLLPRLRSALERRGTSKWLLSWDEHMHVNADRDRRSLSRVLEQFQNFKQTGSILRRWKWC